MDLSNIVAGINYEKEYVVENKDTAAVFGNKNVPVFATPRLCSWLEETCIESVKPFLPAGAETVGTSISFKHMAATPVGMKVRVVVNLVEVNGKLLQFNVKAYDEFDKICEGTHGRAIIDLKKFLSRVETKGK